ncbi:MAG TPA: 50S ribosomal protein L4 [Propionibacteriaceae bacterium]|nr:50S ribosomal protein L4 [Propionibacteriaceae bacterium]
MSTIDVLDATGSKAGTVELPSELFDVTANIPLIHQVVVAQLAAARQGTHATKGRGEVRGGGKKPYRQKGTGRARQGSIRAPQYVGGGTVHGPQPHGYAQRTPKKMIAAALRGALSDRAREGRVHVVQELVPGDVPSTKTALAALRAATSSDKVLVVLHRDEDLSWLSLRNVVTVHALAVDQLNAYDVLVNDEIVFTEAALDAYVGHRARGIAEDVSEPIEIELAAAQPRDAELASASVETSAEPTDAELAATAATVADVIEPADEPAAPVEAAHGMRQAEDVDEEDARLSEPASSPSNTGAPRTGPTSVSEENL